MATTVTYSNDVLRVQPKLKTITSAYTATLSDAGTVFLSKDGADLTLPAVKEGFACKLYIGEAATQDSTIVLTAPTGTLEGVIIEGSAAVLAVNGATTITFATGSEYGDYVEIFSDGTAYIVNGMARGATVS
jgi:hypothetical protein